MDNTSLLKFLMSRYPMVRGPEGRWECEDEGVRVYCLTDERADRMRFMASLALSADLDTTTLRAMLEANFHSALDARLAISDDTVWSLFLSPLSLLTEELAANGLDQVVTLAKNTARGDFHSGQWQFGGGD